MLYSLLVTCFLTFLFNVVCVSLLLVCLLFCVSLFSAAESDLYMFLCFFFIIIKAAPPPFFFFFSKIRFKANPTSAAAGLKGSAGPSLRSGLRRLATLDAAAEKTKNPKIAKPKKKHLFWNITVFTGF